MGNSLKKILIISVSAGSGHVRAAQALEETAKAQFPNLIVEHIDLLDYLSLPTKKIFFDSYRKLATDLPKLWGFFYNSINIPKRREQFDKLTNLLKKFEAKKGLLKKINEFEPDYIISTHFSPTDIILQHKSTLKKMPKLATVITDYGIHELWLREGVDRYFVATEKMSLAMQKRGIDKNIITVSGIPVDPKFTKKIPLVELKKQPKNSANQKNILILSGGQGTIDIEQIVESIKKSKSPLHIVAVAGTNKKLFDRLKNIQIPNHINLEVLGWTDQIHTYLGLADLVITKPGGLTISEAIAMKKPIIAVQPIPGQEDKNLEHLIEEGFGVVAHTAEEILFYLEQDPTSLAPGFNKKSSRPVASRIILEKISS